MVSLVILSVCLFGCDNYTGVSEPENTTLSFNEKVSYYDNLANAGEVESVEATDPSALYRITGSRMLINAEVYDKIVDTFNRTYPNIYYKYGKEYYEPIITINFDPTYLRDDPANVVGNTININIQWFNNNPDKAGIITYYIVTTVLDYNSSAPEWLRSSVNYYIAAEFEATGYDFLGAYRSGSYEDGGEVGADFLYWIKAKYNVDIAHKINKVLSSTEWFDDEFWVEQTGRTLNFLWSEYKAQ